jgi:mannosyltransferase
MKDLFLKTKTILSHYACNKVFLYSIVPLVFVLVNFYLKLKHITTVSIAGDEPFSIYISQLDIPSIIRILSQGNNPPLFEIILHYWTKVFGIGALSVRFLPCVFSSLTVWLVYRIGTKFFSTKVGILSAILYTFSSYEVYFAHETRVYSLFLLITCISFYAFMSILREPTNKYRVIHVVSLILLPYAHYFGFFVFFIQIFIILFFAEIRRSFWKMYAIDLCLALLFYIPFIPVFIHRFFDSAVHGTWVPPVRNLGQLHDVIKFLMNDNVTCFVLFMFIIWLVVWKFISEIAAKLKVKYIVVSISIFYFLYALSLMMPMPQYYKFSAIPAAMISYLIMVTLLLLYTLRSDKVSLYGRIILAWFMLPLLIMFIASFWMPMFLDRYLIYFTATFYILAGMAISYLEEMKIPGVSMLLVGLMILTFTTNPDNKRHTSEAIAKVLELKTSNSVVYICPDYFDLNFAYYYDKKLFTNIDKDNLKGNLLKGLALNKIYPIIWWGQIDTSLIRKSDKVIYLDGAADFCYPGNKLKTYLDSCMQPTNNYFYFEIYHVIEYKPKKKNVFNHP